MYIQNTYGNFHVDRLLLLSMEKSCTVISREIERRTNLKYNRKYAAILSLLFIVNIIGNTACGNTSAETGHVSIADMAMENITPIISIIPFRHLLLMYWWISRGMQETEKSRQSSKAGNRWKVSG